MDFVSGLRLTPTKKDSVWVKVNCLTKSAHFLPVRIDYSLHRLARLYISEIVRLHGSSIQMAPYEALYGHKCRKPLCWTELGENKVLGTYLVQESDNEKSYADLRRRDIEFSFGDQIFLKVSPWKKVLRFGSNRKLSLRFIGPYRVLKRVGLVAYQLELPLELDRIHDVFHVSILRRYCSDHSLVIPIDEVEVRPNLTYEEEPVQILDRKVKKLRKKHIPLVKVL
ncbi:uncharacterized protein LOC108481327 [Gossypium arboreum]|uniref:uncharacterized protein LOC108481327 n=1 Tax=Gossypium arboreum TaxID=29729 RepID=UPI00081967A0|nr:uncharacterized protein LOC108481327 [Gossypium arboreum]